MNETLYQNMRQVYLESIAPADPRPQILKENILEAKKRLDPVGKEDEDIDNDGDSDESDRYLSKRRSAIGKALGARKIKEEFIIEPVELYDWRSNVGEDIQNAVEGLNGEKQIGVKKVDNYGKGANGKRVVTINPNITELKEKIDDMGGEVISEMDINTLSQIAAEYFIENGINNIGVKSLIEELGDQEFSEWVMDIVDENVIMEARRGGERIEPITKTGKKVGTLKGSAKSAAITRLRKEKGARREAEQKRSEKPSNMTAALKAQREIARKTATRTAVAKQETKSRPPGQERLIRGAQQTFKKATSPETTRAVTKSVADALARTALSAWEGHKSAMKAKKSGKGLGRQLASGAGSTLGAFFKKGTEHFKEYIEYLMDEGYDLANITLQDLYEEMEYLEEKASSEQQQKIFGLALSVKRGEKPRSEVSEDVLEIVDSMSEKKIRDFAKTKHQGIPKQVAEGVTYDKIISIIKK